MHQEASCSVDTIEQTQESKSEKIREITIVEKSPRSRITGKFVFTLFLVGILFGDAITYIMHAGSLYDKLFASVMMVFVGAVAGAIVWASRKYLFKK